MGFPGPFSNIFKKDEEQKSFLALTILPDKILAAIWDFADEKIEVLGFGKKSLGHANVLIHQAAVVIDKAGEEAKTDVSKVVFGLSHFYFSEGSPSKDALAILKKLARDLELSPQAYVSCAASVNHFLKIEEKVTPNVIVIGVFENFTEVHLLEGNNVAKSQVEKGEATVGRITQLVADLAEEGKDLPARIVVFGPDEKDSLLQKLSKADWKSIFVHEPKVDLMDLDELAKATAYAQAADVLGHEPSFGEKSKAQIPVEASKETGEEIEDEHIVKEPEAAGAGRESDFVEGKDVLMETFRESQDTEEYAVPRQDIADISIPKTGPPAKSSMSKILDKVTTLSYLPNFFETFKKGPVLKKVAIGLVILVLALFAASFVLGKTVTSAQVVISANSQSIDGDVDAEVVLGTADESKSELSGRKIAVSEAGSQKATATGVEKVGEPAKGEVTVFNWTTDQISFPKSTVIVSSGDIKFTIDNEVEIASRSASNPGQANTNVTAAENGESGNVGAGTDFSFQEFDELLYSARSNNSFSGGQEKEVTVASQEDLTKLEKSLFEELSEKARDKLKSELSSEKLVDEAVLAETLRKNFDKKAGDEASLVNLDMEVEASAVVFDEQNLRNVLAKSLEGKVPQGFKARGEDIEIREISAKRRKDSLFLSGSFAAKLIPDFSEDQLKDQIKGKSIKEARAKVLEIPNVSGVEIKFSPGFLFTSSLPSNPAKIKFKVESN